MRDEGSRSWRGHATVLLAVLFACTGGSDQIMQPPPTVVSVGPAGGTVVLPDSISTLVVPAGALTSDVSFTIRAVEGAPASGLLVQGTVFAIDPMLQFAAPATLRLAYADLSLPPGVREAELAVHRVEGTWVAVEPSVVDSAARVVEAALTATDTVGILGRAAALLAISPAAADLFVGDSIRLLATPLDAAGRPLEGRAIAWTSNKPGIALVRNDGTVVAQSGGSAEVSAYADTAGSVAAIEVKERPPQSALYPHQPFGATVLMDYDTDFGQIAVPPWDFSIGAANLATVSDPTAPVNPSAVGRVTFEPGCCAGSGPSRLETYTGQGRGTPPPGWKRWYISDWVKLSSGWAPNAEGLLTVFQIYVNSGGGPGSWIFYRLEGTGPYTPRVAVEGPAVTGEFGSDSVSVLAGQWYHFETVVYNSGRIMFWVNNSLVYDGTPATVQFVGEFLAWTWTYGGTSPYGGAVNGYVSHNHMRSSYTVE